MSEIHAMVSKHLCQEVVLGMIRSPHDCVFVILFRRVEVNFGSLFVTSISIIEIVGLNQHMLRVRIGGTQKLEVEFVFLLGVTCQLKR